MDGALDLFGACSLPGGLNELHSGHSVQGDFKFTFGADYH